MVPGERLELSRSQNHRILSPARLPVPPSRRASLRLGVRLGLEYKVALCGKQGEDLRSDGDGKRVSGRAMAADAGPSSGPSLRRSDFRYELPAELIAQYPLAERSASRLLCLDRTTGALQDRRFQELPALLRAGDLLVFNDTRVVPARLFGRKDSGGRIEVLVERLLDAYTVLAQVRASKPPRTGACLHLEGEAVARVVGREDEFYRLRFTTAPALQVLEASGHMPLPPYIRRRDEVLDRQRYQTVFARRRGAVAAPTAGLHFDEDLLVRVRERGVELAWVTLHVGAGTFQPVRSEDLRAHRMHREYLEVPAATCEAVQQARRRGGRVIAVGTTVVRSLETAARDGALRPYAGETDLFILPGHAFRAVDALITNFHLPESTLLMLVCAFAGREQVLAAYRHAVAERYRFFSYGDAMFIA